ncbi:jg2846, partial [Pararge aegeria aegeria]
HLVNGISFAQSGLFLYLALTALSTEVDSVSSAEIDRYLHLQLSDSGKIKLLNQIVSWLPTSSVNLKFRWATRLVLEAGLPVTQKFRQGSAPALKLQVEWLNGTETLGNLTKTLNSRVKTDSGGAMRNTFEEDDFSEGACSILLNTLYFRARWRSPPTVLNGSRPFHDSELTQPQRSVRMIRINDVMRYADIEEWNAEKEVSNLSQCYLLDDSIQRFNRFVNDNLNLNEHLINQLIINEPRLIVRDRS